MATGRPQPELPVDLKDRIARRMASECLRLDSLQNWTPQAQVMLLTRCSQAVGSLHVVGPVGLPSLMAEKSYRVERTIPP